MTVDVVTIDAAPLALTTEQRQDLAELEGVISRGQQTFIEVGMALASIQADRLYREKHATFEAYLTERWPDIGRRRAYQLIEGAEIAQNVNPGTQTAITSERQARALTGLPPEQQRQAWEAAVQSAPGGKPTSAQVEQAAAQFKLPPDFASAQERAQAVGWTLRHDGSEFVLTSPTNEPIFTSQWGLIKSKLDELEEAAPHEIAEAAPAPALPPALPVAAPAMPPPLLSPAQSVASQADQQLRKMLVVKRVLLLATLELLEAELLSRPGPEIIVQADRVAEQARMFLNAPALNGAAAMLSFSAREEAA